MYTLYIGENNETHELEVQKAILIIDQYFSRFTWYIILGMWKGAGENVMKVEIVTDDRMEIGNMILELKRELAQESILLSYNKCENTFA